ncbi:hypothetical protein Pla163_36110 [Planctomycetes bacterium Pla163]|uniref:Lipoprotein n=1 Tax=Rohdeia mirabilis TaxID=2528008 RepID=A0A518D4S1_9BACT|nr:hypothetical protein Pla163_36110 [Planctomycetes bacterium Pla163]
MRRILSIALTALLLPACATPPNEVPLFARAQLATDFDTYVIRRVGVLPVRLPAVGGRAMDPRSAFMQNWFASQVELSTPYEVIAISEAEMRDVPDLDPRRSGRHDVEAVLGLARRFELDGLILVDVADQHPYPPQRIALHAELVACETGATIWSSDVHLDAREPRVRAGLEAYVVRTDGTEFGAERTDVALLSPRSFAEFALWQLAQML